MNLCWVSTILVILVQFSNVYATNNTIVYNLQYHYEDRCCVKITMSLPPSTPAGSLTLVIPRAIPDDYAIELYDNFLFDLECWTNQGATVYGTKEDAGPRWDLGFNQTFAPKERITIVSYRINVTMMEEEIMSGSDSSKVRHDYVGILGVSVFAYIDGMQDHPITLNVEGPQEWPVYSTLNPTYPPNTQNVSAEAANYYALADSQIAFGREFWLSKSYIPQSQVTLYVLIYNEGNGSKELNAKLAFQGMTETLKYFGNVPFSSFTLYMEFLKPITPQHQYGFSLEHLESVTMCYLYDDAPTSKSTNPELYGYLFNMVHHFSHAWIPKRCYTPGYFPFIWEVAPAFDAIWFAEGFAQYIAIVITSSMVQQPKAYVDCMLDGRFKAIMSTAPTFIQQMDTIYLSFVSSTQYSLDFRTGSNVFSRGGLMARDIDLTINITTNGNKSLQDAIRGIVAWTERHQKAFTIDQIPQIFKDATGVDVTSVMSSWLQAPIHQTTQVFADPSVCIPYGPT